MPVVDEMSMDDECPWRTESPHLKQEVPAETTEEDEPSPEEIEIRRANHCNADRPYYQKFRTLADKVSPTELSENMKIEVFRNGLHTDTQCFAWWDPEGETFGSLNELQSHRQRKETSEKKRFSEVQSGSPEQTYVQRPS